MQKTFDVWVKNLDGVSIVCSKKVGHDVDELMEIDASSSIIDYGAEIRECDVSQWLESLDMKVDEVKSFNLTLKEN